MTTNYNKCTEALNNEKDIKSKYPTIVKEFAEWYDEQGWDDAGLGDEFTAVEDAEDAAFLDWLREKDVTKTDEEGLEIWQILHEAITATTKLTKTQSVESSGSEKEADSPPNATKKQPVTIVVGDIKNHQTPQNFTPNGSIRESTKPVVFSMSDSVIVKILSTEIASSERKTNVESSKSPLKKKIDRQAPKMLPAASNSGGFFKKNKNKKDKKTKNKNNSAQDILHVELLGYKNNNYPLLIHFVDAAVRCQMNEWIKKGKRTSGQKISTNDFFDQYCNHPRFKEYLKTSNATNVMELVKTAIDSYQHRILPPFQLIEPIWKINGNPLDLCNYMFEMARIARNSANQPIHNYSSIIPIQIEFLILNDKIQDVRPAAENCIGVDALFDDNDQKEDSSSEDDEVDDFPAEDDDEKEVIPKDINQLLKSNKIKPIIYEKPLRNMLRCTEDIKRVVDNKRCKRTVFILDRRDNKNKDSDVGGTDGDKLYLFKPVRYNEFEKNDQERIHGSLHHNSINSVVPRPASNSDFTVLNSLRGQMFVISFHIISKEEIRCYLFYQGQCFRFYGEDLINVLPIFFVDSKKARDIMLTKYNHEQKWRKAFDEFCQTFDDKKFEKFYHGLTGKSPRLNVIQ